MENYINITGFHVYSRPSDCDNEHSTTTVAPSTLPLYPFNPPPLSQYPYKYVYVCVHLSNINNLYVKMRVALTIYLQFYFQLAAKPVLPLSLVG